MQSIYEYIFEKLSHAGRRGPMKIKSIDKKKRKGERREKKRSGKREERRVEERREAREGKKGEKKEGKWKEGLKNIYDVGGRKITITELEGNLLLKTASP